MRQHNVQLFRNVLQNKDPMKKILILSMLFAYTYAVQAAVTELNDSIFTDATSDGNVLVKFYSPTCPPCKMSKPVLEKLSQSPDYANVEFFEVDIAGKNDAAASKFAVHAMPTFIFLQGGKEVDRIVGFDETSLKHKLNKHFGPGKSKKKEVPVPRAEIVEEDELAALMPAMTQEHHEMMMPEEMPATGEAWYSPITNFFKGIYDSIYNFMFR